VGGRLRAALSAPSIARPLRTRAEALLDHVVAVPAISGVRFRWRRCGAGATDSNPRPAA
jgi:hypothetical protein